MNSREKGKRGEREFVEFLKGRGIHARRGQQFNGTEGKDVIHGMTGIHFEVKRTEQLRLNEAYAQARRDADFEAPVVAWKRNRGRWMAIMAMDDLIDLLWQKQEKSK